MKTEFRQYKSDERSLDDAGFSSSGGPNRIGVWKTLPEPRTLPEPLSSGSVINQNAKIHFQRYGDPEKPTLVFLHGGLGNTTQWGNQVPAFEANYNIILIDSRGHGKSTRSDDPYTYDLMKSDVLAVLDNLNIKSANFVGWSDGGIIGLLLAKDNPERTLGVFAFGVNTRNTELIPKGDETPTFRAYIERMKAQYSDLSTTPKEFDPFLDAVYQMWLSEPNISNEELKRIQRKIAIVLGEHDEVIPQEHAREIATIIPGATFTLLNDGSHFALWQIPESFNEAITRFLNSSSDKV